MSFLFLTVQTKEVPAMRWLKAPHAVLGFSLALLLAIVGPLGKTASA
jgi:hypothetical protein